MAIAKLPERKLKSISDIVDISQCIYWCLEATRDTANSELQCLAMSCAVKAELYDIIDDVLMNAFLPDSLKMEILIMLGERNRDDRFTFVFFHTFKELEFHALSLGKAKRKKFISAYATLTAHFCVLDTSLSVRFAKVCEELYRELEREKRLDVVDDVRALSAAVYYRTNVGNTDINRKTLSDFFDAPDEKIAEILGEKI